MATSNRLIQSPKTITGCSSTGVEELLTIDELATLLKVPKSWIYSHTRPRAKVRLPYVKLGKYLRFSEPEVRLFLQRLNRRGHVG